jgi:hypothetical protein
MKVTTWALLVLVLVAGAHAVVQPAQGCPAQAQKAAPAQKPAKTATPRPAGHSSFIIAARMGWL